jgi:hypothetical protein
MFEVIVTKEHTVGGKVIVIEKEKDGERTFQLSEYSPALTKEELIKAADSLADFCSRFTR